MIQVAERARIRARCEAASTLREIEAWNNMRERAWAKSAFLPADPDTEKDIEPGGHVRGARPGLFCGTCGGTRVWQRELRRRRAHRRVGLHVPVVEGLQACVRGKTAGSSRRAVISIWYLRMVGQAAQDTAIKYCGLRVVDGVRHGKSRRKRQLVLAQRRWSSS